MLNYPTPQKKVTLFVVTEHESGVRIAAAPTGFFLGSKYCWKIPGIGEISLQNI